MGVTGWTTTRPPRTRIAISTRPRRARRPRRKRYPSNDETLYWLDSKSWSRLRREHNLVPDEGRAAREVHRRIIESIDGDVSYYNRDRDAFVLVKRVTAID